MFSISDMLPDKNRLFISKKEGLHFAVSLFSFSLNDVFKKDLQLTSFRVKTQTT